MALSERLLAARALPWGLGHSRAEGSRWSRTRRPPGPPDHGAGPLRRAEARRPCPAGRHPGPDALRRQHDPERARAAGAGGPADRGRGDRPADVRLGSDSDHPGDRRRHPRLRPAGALPARPHSHRGDGEQRGGDLRRAGRQADPSRRRVRRRVAPAPDHRQDRGQDRPTRGRDQPDGRRSAARRQPGQRDHPAAGPGRLEADHPQVRRGPVHRRGPHLVRHADPSGCGPPRRLREGASEHPGLGRYWRRQDHDPERAVVVHPARRAHRDDRGRRGAAAPPGPRPATRVATGQHRGQGCGTDPRPGAELVADATGPHRRR